MLDFPTPWRDGVQVSSANQRSSISIVGTIDETTFKDYIRLTRSLDARSPFSVVIRSRGGDNAASLRIATDLARRRAHVHVDGYCLSSCASIILAGGLTRSKSKGSVVGFHSTSTFYYQFYKSKSIIPSWKLTDLANGERTMYKLRGIRKELLTDPGFAVEPICFETSTLRPTPETTIRIGFRRNFWFPSNDVLSGYGFSIRETSKASWFTTSMKGIVERKQFVHAEQDLESLPRCLPDDR